MAMSDFGHQRTFDRRSMRRWDRSVLVVTDYVRLLSINAFSCRLSVAPLRCAWTPFKAPPGSTERGYRLSCGQPHSGRFRMPALLLSRRGAILGAAKVRLSIDVPVLHRLRQGIDPRDAGAPVAGHKGRPDSRVRHGGNPILDVQRGRFVNVIVHTRSPIAAEAQRFTAWLGSVPQSTCPAVSTFPRCSPIATHRPPRAALEARGSPSGSCGAHRPP
jgi:hypothetical protein